MTPDRIARGYLILTLSVLCALPYLLGTQEQQLNVASQALNSGEGDSIKQIGLAILYAVGALLLIRSPRRQILFLGLPILLLLAWCLVSVVWSVNPEGSIRRLVALLGIVSVGIYAGLRLDLRGMIRVFTAVAAVVLVASLAVAMSDPQSGLDPEGRLRGVFYHKNFLCSFATIALFTICIRFAAKLDRQPVVRVMLGLLALICLACIGASQSVGPLPAAFMMFVVLSVVWTARSSDGRFRALLPVLIAAGIVSAGTLILVFGGSMFGRAPDLSGRTEVWQFAASMAERRLWTGYGYGVFWLGANAPAAPFWKATRIFVAHAHNGYLQLALDAGLVGVGFLGAALIVLATKVGMLLRCSQDICLFWIVGFTAFFFFSNLGEAEAWVGNDLHTALFVYVAVRTNIEYARHSSILQNFAMTRRATGGHDTGRSVSVES
jgi:exopolysaccharide production protein ExoQ